MLLLLIAEALLKNDVLKSCKKVVNQPIPLNKCSLNQSIGAISRAVAVANKKNLRQANHRPEMPQYAVVCRDMPTCPGPPCIEKISQFGRNKAITRHIEAGKSSKIVVKGSVCAICAAERPLMRLNSGHLARRTATQIRRSFEV